jgi:pyridoxal phosphate enzyme (YggS family)
MSDPALNDRLDEIREVVAARQRAGGWTHQVRIVAVTKGHGPEAVVAAAAAGLDTVGENRVQEALEKQGQCAGVPIAWHLIGTLQKNKARLAAGRFGMVHSIDRLDLAIEVARRTPSGTRQQVLVQVNCSHEAQKGGVLPPDLAALLDGMRILPAIEVRGLMTMAEFSDDEQVQRAAFSQLRRLRETMTSAGHLLPELSMGMSGDYGAAVEEGATMLRLGSVLFGSRT